MGAVCLMRTLNQLARCVQGKGGGGDFVVIPLRAQSSRPLIVYSMVGTTDYNKRDTMSQPNRRLFKVLLPPMVAALAQMPGLSFIVSVFGSWSIIGSSRGGEGPRDRPSDSSVDDVNRHFIFHVLLLSKIALHL